MDYFRSNQAAWEEAFDHRTENWCENMGERLQNETLPYLNPMLAIALQTLDLRDKMLAQFCCNNGRELFSAMQLGARAGVGFDIAANMMEAARGIAAQTGIACKFETGNILEIGAEYNGAFNLVFFTIGAITWFQDLEALFAVAARCLKPGGTLLINDFHPMINMLPIPGEDAFDPEHTDRVAYSYFRTEPWLENDSAGYMTGHRNSRTFTSFSHTMGSIINALAASGLYVTSLEEYDRDIGIADAYNGKGFPLSFTLLAVKRGLTE